MTRKITRGISNIIAGKQKVLYLGNLDAKRDWGYAPEYVECMWRILQAESPDDFVVGTGETHSVKGLWKRLSLISEWIGKNSSRSDPKYFRPTEVEALVAKSGKARKVLGWVPKIKFSDLVKIMMDADMKAAGLRSPGEGDAILKKKFPAKWWGID